MTNSYPAMTDLRKFIFRIAYPDHRQNLKERSLYGGLPTHSILCKSVLTFRVILLTDKQTNSQTKKTGVIT